MKTITSSLHEKLDTTVKSMGYEFVGGEIVNQNRSSVLRLYIDGPKGITIDECSRISRQLSAVLDVEDPIQGDYRLEVSSPGVDRPLFTPQQYEKFVGQTVKVKLRVPIEQRRQYKGELQRVESDRIHIQVEGVEHAVQVPFSAIDRANLVAEIEFKKTK